MKVVVQHGSRARQVQALHAQSCDRTDAYLLDASSFYSNSAAFFEATGAGQPGHLPMPKLISADTVRKDIAQRSPRIFANFKLLGQILDRHEPTIHKRVRTRPCECRRTRTSPLRLTVAQEDERAEEEAPHYRMEERHSHYSPTRLCCLAQRATGSADSRHSIPRLLLMAIHQPRRLDQAQDSASVHERSRPAPAR